jgi:hypothetical protein
MLASSGQRTVIALCIAAQVRASLVPTMLVYAPTLDVHPVLAPMLADLSAKGWARNVEGEYCVTVFG